MDVATKILIFNMITDIDDKRVVPYPDEDHPEFTVEESNEFYQSFFDTHIKRIYESNK